VSAVGGSGISALAFKPIGDQPPFAPETLERFVAAARSAMLSYVRHDGRPGQIPIWYVYRDGAFFASTVTGSPKHRALLRDPRVCLAIQDERPPYRAVMFDATVEMRPAGPGSPVDGIERRYFGRIGGEEYRKMTNEAYAATGLTEIIIRPENVRGFDNSSLSSWPTTLFVRLRPRIPLLRRWL